MYFPVPRMGDVNMLLINNVKIFDLGLQKIKRFGFLSMSNKQKVKKPDFYANIITNES